MHEYGDEAIVIAAEPNGDKDTRFFLFTKRFGKLSAKAKSARKITSKLTPHLQLGNVTRIRLIQKNGLQLTDALKIRKTSLPPPDLYRLNALLPEETPETALWHLIAKGEFTWSLALKALGWDPEHAACAQCGNGAVAAFALRGQEFFCASCASKSASDAVLYLA